MTTTTTTNYKESSTWIALAGSIGLILPSGVSVAFLYGFLFCVLCSLCVVASLEELAAIWPTADGQYHYVFCDMYEKMAQASGMQTVFRISPTSDRYRVSLSGGHGWLIVVTVQGDFAGRFICFILACTSLILAAQFISAAIVVASNDSYQITPARTYGIFLAVLSATTAINIWGLNILGSRNTGACKSFPYMCLKAP